MATGTTVLTCGNKHWAIIDLQHVNGVGRLSPRLGLNFKCSTPTERIQTELHHVRLQLQCENEFLGEGAFVGVSVSSIGSNHSIEVPVSHQMLDYVTAKLGAGADLNFKIFWTGIVRVNWSPAEKDPQMPGDPEPGTWTQLPLNHTEQACSMARSDWYSKVLQPTQQNQFIYSEVEVPIGGMAVQWAQVMTHVSDADKAFALGDDAGVFAKLRGAFEALPGYPKEIVAGLPEPQRSEVDDLLKAVGHFLHSGRHVSQVGDSAGLFPVDRRDAYFALSTTKVVLSYLSKLVD